jgi:hypothetical protein
MEFLGEGEGECSFQVCHFLVQFTALPLIFPSWGAFHAARCFFLHVFVKRHHEIRRKSGSAGYEATPRHTRPPIHDLSVPHPPLDLGVTHGISPL